MFLQVKQLVSSGPLHVVQLLSQLAQAFYILSAYYPAGQALVLLILKH